MDGAVPPEYLVVGDGGVAGVVPVQLNGVVADTGDGQARGRVGGGALLSPGRSACEEEGERGDEDE